MTEEPALRAARHREMIQRFLQICRVVTRAQMVLLAGLLLCACSTPLVQPSRPIVKPPEIQGRALLPGDDTHLPLRAWLPEKAPKALIIALHGFNDYSHAFEQPGSFLRERGIAVFAYDQRGFGATKSHGIWGGEQNLTGDLKQAVIALRTLYPDTPIYLLGESMGGAVAIVALADPGFPKVDGAILSAPAVWGNQTMNGFYRGTLWLMAHTVPGDRMTGKGLKIQASDNIPMLRALGRDPLVIKKTRVDAIYGIVSLMDSAFTKVEQVKTPMLFLYGAKDQVIPRKPVKMAIEKVKAPYNVAYYPEGYHMLLRDLKAETVLTDIASWVKDSRKPLPSGYDQNWREVLK